MSSRESHKLLIELRKLLKDQEFSNAQLKETALGLAGLIDKTIASDSLSVTDRHGLQEQLKDFMTSFEISHPALTASIRNIVDTLNIMGI
jgi:hypothetical protein